MGSVSENIRKWFGESDRERDRGLTTPEDVYRWDDILYGKDEKWQVLDVYRPKCVALAVSEDEPEGTQSQLMKLPVIVSVHGGAWMYGDKDVYQFYCMSLAQRGFAVVNFTYRLAPEHKFPSSLEDTNLVFHWVLDHADAFGFDTEHIFAVGDSAGGHLLSLYCAFCTNPHYADKFPFQPVSGFAPKAVALNCGVYYMNLQETKKQQDVDIFRELMPGGGTPEEMTLVNPLPFISEKYPPVYLVTANADDTIDPLQAQKMEARLKEMQVDYIRREYGSKESPLGHVFFCNVRSEAARICNDETCDFFRNQYIAKGRSISYNK